MRWRWMYYMTGLPGWMRFGFSPGWVGRSPYGLPPGAHYLLTGYWPTPQANWMWNMMQASYPGYSPLYDPWGITQISPEQELEILKGQAEVLEDQLDGIRKRIAELESQEKK